MERRKRLSKGLGDSGDFDFEEANVRDVADLGARPQAGVGRNDQLVNLATPERAGRELLQLHPPLIRAEREDVDQLALNVPLFRIP